MNLNEFVMNNSLNEFNEFEKNILSQKIQQVNSRVSQQASRSRSIGQTKLRQVCNRNQSAPFISSKNNLKYTSSHPNDNFVSYSSRNKNSNQVFEKSTDLSNSKDIWYLKNNEHLDPKTPQKNELLGISTPSTTNLQNDPYENYNLLKIKRNLTDNHVNINGTQSTQNTVNENSEDNKYDYGTKEELSPNLKNRNVNLKNHFRSNNQRNYLFTEERNNKVESLDGIQSIRNSSRNSGVKSFHIGHTDLNEKPKDAYFSKNDFINDLQLKSIHSKSDSQLFLYQSTNDCQSNSQLNQSKNGMESNSKLHQCSNDMHLQKKHKLLEIKIFDLKKQIERESIKNVFTNSIISELRNSHNNEDSQSYIHTINKQVVHLRKKVDRYQSEINHYGSLIKTIEENTHNMDFENNELKEKLKRMKIKKNTYGEVCFLRKDRVETFDFFKNKHLSLDSRNRQQIYMMMLEREKQNNVRTNNLAMELALIKGSDLDPEINHQKNIVVKYKKILKQ